MTTEQTEEKPVLPTSLVAESRGSEKETKLASLLLTSVNETINKIFKEAGAKVIFDFLEKNYDLKLEEIVKKPEVFSTGFERLTVSAAFMIEMMILENLYSKLDLKFVEKKGYEFSDYVNELRRNINVEE